MNISEFRIPNLLIPNHVFFKLPSMPPLLTVETIESDKVGSRGPNKSPKITLI